MTAFLALTALQIAHQVLRKTQMKVIMQEFKECSDPFALKNILNIIIFINTFKVSFK